MNKCGQMQQLFVIMATLFVIAATVFIGMKLVNNLSGVGCAASSTTLLKEIKSTFDEYSSFGSKRTVSIGATCDATALCFIDSRIFDTAGGTALRAGFIGDDQVIVTAVKNNVQSNIYLQGKETTPLGYDSRIITAPRGTPFSLANAKALCIPVTGGNFKFMTEGYGMQILVKNLP
jgi:hypothetical protein